MKLTILEGVAKPAQVLSSRWLLLVLRVGEGDKRAAQSSNRRGQVSNRIAFSRALSFDELILLTFLITVDTELILSGDVPFLWRRLCILLLYVKLRVLRAGDQARASACAHHD